AGRERDEQERQSDYGERDGRASQCVAHSNAPANLFDDFTDVLQLRTHLTFLLETNGVSIPPLVACDQSNGIERESTTGSTGNTGLLMKRSNYARVSLPSFPMIPVLPVVPSYQLRNSNPPRDHCFHYKQRKSRDQQRKPQSLSRFFFIRGQA